MTIISLKKSNFKIFHTHTIMLTIISCDTNFAVAPNSTSNETWIEVGSPEHREIWMSRLREVKFNTVIISFTIFFVDFYVHFQNHRAFKYFIKTNSHRVSTCISLFCDRFRDL